MIQKTAKIIISYDGSQFFGYAKQPHKNSVQDTLESAFCSLGIKINEQNKLIASGRTDKGVHATYQVLSLKIPYFWVDNLSNLILRLNNTLPNTIYIKDIKLTKDTFHARFSAKKRVYRYIVCDEVSVFESNYITKFNLKGKEKIVKKALKELVGTYDFRFFSKEEKDKNSIRTIHKVYFYKKIINHKTYYIFSIYGNAFLRNQIRLIVNFIFEIVLGKLSIFQLQQQLNCIEQYNTQKAPSAGLYLSKVIYI